MPIPPVVRSMVVCDGVVRQPGTGNKLDIRGVLHTIKATPGGAFPYTYPELCVYLVLTGGAGVGRVKIVVVEADSEAELFGTPEHTMSHPADRHHVGGVTFRVQDCIFPRPGLYWVEFRHDDLTLRAVPLVLR